MPDIGKMLLLFLIVEMVMGLVWNISPKLPRLPGDIDINKGGFRIYVPLASALIVSIILTFYFNFFK